MTGFQGSTSEPAFVASKTLTGTRVGYRPGGLWQCLYLRPDRHGHRSLRPTFRPAPGDRAASFETNSVRRSRASSSVSSSRRCSLHRRSRFSASSTRLSRAATCVYPVASSRPARCANARESSPVMSPNALMSARSMSMVTARPIEIPTESHYRFHVARFAAVTGTLTVR